MRDALFCILTLIGPRVMHSCIVAEKTNSMNVAPGLFGNLNQTKNAMKFICPLCGVRIEAEDAWSGRQVDCPNCAEQITIPVSDMPSSPHLPQNTVPVSEIPNSIQTSTQSRGSDGPKSKINRYRIKTTDCVIAVAALMFCVVAVFAVYSRLNGHAGKAPANQNSTNNNSPHTKSFSKDNNTIEKNFSGEKPPRGALVVKGLWLGMDGEKAVRIIVERGKGKISTRPTNATTNENNLSGYDLFLPNINGTREEEYRSGAILTEPKTGKVTWIIFEKNLSEFLFGFSDMTDEEFAQEFINNYKIPKLKPSSSGGDLGWKYISDDGWILFISNIGVLNIKLDHQRKFD